MSDPIRWVNDNGQARWQPVATHPKYTEELVRYTYGTSTYRGWLTLDEIQHGGYHPFRIIYRSYSRAVDAGARRERKISAANARGFRQEDSE